MKNMKVVLGLMLFITTVMLMSGCVNKDKLKTESSVVESASAGSTVEEQKNSYTINCSTDTLPMAIEIATQIQNTKSIKIDAVAVGKDLAIETLATDTNSLAFFEGQSDLITPETSYILGYDAIGVIVPKDSPLSNITSDELTALFIGEIDQLGDQTFTIVLPEKDNASRYTFEQIFQTIGKVNGMQKSLVPDGAIIKTSIEEVIAEVANTPNTIGVVPLNASLDQVKLLTINDVPSDFKNIQSGAYLGARPIMIAASTKDSLALKYIIEWAQSNGSMSAINKLNVTVK